MASSSLSEVRQISRGLRPYQLDRFGLTTALTAEVKKISESSTLTLRPTIENMDGKFSNENEINVYRIVQESLTNIMKHADATEVELRVLKEDDHVHINIADNGKGFSIHESMENSSLAEGFGLQGIRERVSMMNGTIVLTSNPGSGTTIDVKLPVKKCVEMGTA